MAEIPFTLDQLRILKAIVDEGSFKKAADSLFVTQPAVSLQVQNLEKQLDIAIFDSCLLYTSPSPRDLSTSRMPSSA